MVVDFSKTSNAQSLYSMQRDIIHSIVPEHFTALGTSCNIEYKLYDVRINDSVLHHAIIVHSKVEVIIVTYSQPSSLSLK